MLTNLQTNLLPCPQLRWGTGLQAAWWPSHPFLSLHGLNTGLSYCLCFLNIPCPAATALHCLLGSSNHPTRPHFLLPILRYEVGTKSGRNGCWRGRRGGRGDKNGLISRGQRRFIPGEPDHGDGVTFPRSSTCKGYLQQRGLMRTHVVL